MECVGSQYMKDNPYHYPHYIVQQSPIYKFEQNQISRSTDAVLETNSTGAIQFIETFPARLCQLNAKYLPLNHKVKGKYFT